MDKFMLFLFLSDYVDLKQYPDWLIGLNSCLKVTVIEIFFVALSLMYCFYFSTMGKKDSWTSVIELVLERVYQIDGIFLMGL